jgi:hypothetical protein
MFKGPFIGVVHTADPVFEGTVECVVFLQP